MDGTFAAQAGQSSPPGRLLTHPGAPPKQTRQAGSGTAAMPAKSR